MRPGDRVVDWLAWDPYGKTQYTPPLAPIVPFKTAVGQLTVFIILMAHAYASSIVLLVAAIGGVILGAHSRQAASEVPPL